jgi:hypothetical protein
LLLEIHNKSKEYIVKKVNLQLRFKCKDETTCEVLGLMDDERFENWFQEFDFSKTFYTSISPGKSIERTIDIGPPLPYKDGESLWTWYFTEKEFFGFKLDY